ncbi:procathepsin L-like isoform X1 [Hemicordylus capensis]|uniref:procathepsin L-like isoform X1 n=3 Tax=Hemicordylus capensis TaxID=884348 RepID=UPI002302417A|nr:procathepsin L-like isoform X1 [Hemicordylus capensis]
MGKGMLFISLVAMTWLGLLSTFAAVLDSSLDEAWNEWKSTHAKFYPEAEEEVYRRAVWEKNLRIIEHHNQEAALGKHTYRMGMNQFGALTKEEFNQKMKCFRPELAKAPGKGVTFLQESSTLETPESVDWRKKGYVTEVKNQGQCGSCWSFSATGALEGLHFKTNGKLVSLSEQNLVDCSWQQGNRGCRGGFVNTGFEYVRENNGIDSEENYPYKEKNGHCAYQPSDRAATCTSIVQVPEGNEIILEQAVATAGPVSVGVDSRNFQFYDKGIFYSEGCGERLNHAVLVVGYGTDDTLKMSGKPSDYWIVKNSWNTTWGEKGYMKLAKGAHNHCGIATVASYPTLDPGKGQP